jgi:tetratricopeptide (TPR) repeat protein
VIRPGLDSDEVLRRFRTERQVLAELAHPHIARLLDGGSTDDGRPYFVMEYIDGDPLDRFCEARRLGTRERVELLRLVCAAVQHSHDRGVVHRDLKPGNVLVTAEGVPKVTDFGLAKRLEGDSGGPTQSGAVLGTPSYMAPEQATGRGKAVGPATDVYALGAVLYELLTGRPPFKAETPLDTLEQVLNAEPVPPSRLQPGLPRDLETICLKCLRKDPDRRYPGVAALADDLRRFQAGEPIQARRAGPVTKLHKWAKRNPAVSAALAGLLLLAVAVGILAYQAWRAEQERIAERRQEAIDRALVAALGGEFDAAEKAIREAEGLGAHPGWVRMLQGLVDLHRGDARRAVEQLRQAVDLMPDSVAARAMLLMAWGNAGEWVEVHGDEAAALERLRPVTAEDYLFLGELQAAKDPAAAVRTLDEAIARRKSGVALLIRSWARSRLASDTGTPADAEAAVDDARAARAVLGDTPYVLVMNLSAHNEAAAAYRRTGQADRRAEHLARGDELAGRLEAYRDRVVALIARGYFFCWGKDDVAAALAEWRRASERGSDLATKLHVLGLYRRGEFRQALKVCDAAAGQGRGSPVELDRLYVLAELDLAPARAAYREVARRPRPGEVPLQPTLWYACAARLLEDNAAGDDLIRPQRNSIRRPPGREAWYDALIAYNCGERTDEQLLAAAGASRWAQCEGHYHIAFRRLAAGDRKAAREYFRQAVATHVFGQYELAWGQAFLERLDRDDTWPKWVKLRK